MIDESQNFRIFVNILVYFDKRGGIKNQKKNKKSGQK